MTFPHSGIESLPVEIQSRSNTERNKLNDLSRLIFLDRYAKKDHDRKHLAPGQEVVACVDVERRQRELAYVEEILGDKIRVKIQTDGRLEEVPVEQVDLPIETIGEAQWRMARALAKPERTEARVKQYTEEFANLLLSFSFVPAGRVWAGAGVDEELTPFNCYVIPAPKDSRQGIITTLSHMTEIMARGGGVGIPIMTIRPKHFLVRGVNGRSSGSVAWSEIYSFATNLIEQGGSRRGALMLIQYVWHPDILEFITAKKDMKRLNGANISVAITDDFMAAVETDADWDLVFPDTSHFAFDGEWDGDLELWKAKGYPVQVYKTVKAREIWKSILDSAHASAEPGLFFVDRYNAMSNSFYYKNGKIFCCNPCGEQGIPPWAVCNLGHLNLSKFLIGDGIHRPAELNEKALRAAVRTAVRFMDNVIDIAFAPFDENSVQQKGERRIGLGTMGLGEMLIRMHIRYGKNEKCLKVLDRLYGIIAEEAYLTSADLAEEKGSFPFFDAEKFLNSGFMRQMPEHVREVIRKKGCRNVTLLTQAPTGTVGTMMATSTGIEAFIWWVWERKGRLGTHREYANVYKEYLDAFPEVAKLRSELPLKAQFTQSTHLPEYFVVATELTPEDHAYTQAAIQRWVDSSISKTSNLPSDYTPEQVGEYYKLLFRLGCKGGTVYRDQSRDVQVLNVPKEAEESPKRHKTPEELQANAPSTSGIHGDGTSSVADGELRDVPSSVYECLTVSMPSPAGKLSTKLGLDPETLEPFEVWLDVSRAGTALHADTEAIARLISLVLRLDSPIPAQRRLQLVIDQLSGIGGGDSTGFGPNRVLSVPDSISKALSKLSEQISRKKWNIRTATGIPKAMWDEVRTLISKAEDLAENSASYQLGTEAEKFDNALLDRKVMEPDGKGGWVEKTVREVLENRAWGVEPRVTKLVDYSKSASKKAQSDLCPQCHNATLIRTEGCWQCTACLYSKC